MIRSFTIGRKNWLFINTSRGACSIAVIYSLVNIAKLYKLKPFVYSNYILEILPNIDINDEELEKLMRYVYLPENIYDKKNSNDTSFFSCVLKAAQQFLNYYAAF